MSESNKLATQIHCLREAFLRDEPNNLIVHAVADAAERLAHEVNKLESELAQVKEQLRKQRERYESLAREADFFDDD